MIGHTAGCPGYCGSTQGGHEGQSVRSEIIRSEPAENWGESIPGREGIRSQGLEQVAG